MGVERPDITAIEQDSEDNWLPPADTLALLAWIHHLEKRLKIENWMVSYGTQTEPRDGPLLEEALSEDIEQIT
jgi:hypothetical protein